MVAKPNSEVLELFLKEQKLTLILILSRGYYDDFGTINRIEYLIDRKSEKKAKENVNN